jgi:hypothetical protein
MSIEVLKDWEPTQYLKLSTNESALKSVIEGLGDRKPNIKRERIKLSDIFHDEKLQRKQCKKWLKLLALTFRDDMCEDLIVSCRKNGKYSILDGAHRLSTLLLLGRTHWMCRVYYDLNQEDEGRLFTALNTARRPLKALELFWGELAAKEQSAVAIKALCNEYGFTIPHYPKTEHGTIVQCSQVLQQIYAKGGTDLLRRVLDFICNCWQSSQAERASAAIIKGVYYLMTRSAYVDRGIDLSKLCGKLCEISTKEIICLARSKSAGTHMQMGDAVALALTSFYKTKRGDRTCL